MKDNWEVRPARAAEREALIALWERSVRATHEFLSDADIDELRPVVAGALNHDGLEIWVLTETTDIPLGFMGLVDNDIAALFLEPTQRGQGGGRRLIDHAQKLRGGSLTLDVNEQNPAARGFYETLGFVVVGRSPVDRDGRPFPLLHMRRSF